MNKLKEIQLVIEEQARNSIGNTAAINAIADILQRPEPPPQIPREALDTEEGRTPLKTNPEADIGVGVGRTTADTERKHDVLVLTLTHYCDRKESHVSVKHDDFVDVAFVTLAIESLNQFSRKKFGVEIIEGGVLDVEGSLLADIAELLKKF